MPFINYKLFKHFIQGPNFEGSELFRDINLGTIVLFYKTKETKSKIKQNKRKQEKEKKNKQEK